MAKKIEREAIRFSQPGRTCHMVKMNVEELKNFAPRREPEQLSMFTDTNRPINRNHMGTIERFLADTPRWAMPAVVLSVPPGRVQHKNGTITLDPSDLEIIDGQHRIHAIANLIHQWEADTVNGRHEEIKLKLDELETQELPILIFEVEDKQEHRQIFAWFAKQKPIEPAVRDFFDESDPFGKAAKAVMESSATLQGKVTWKSNTIPERGGDKAMLLTLKQLKDIAATIRVGVKRNPAKKDRELCWREDIQTALQGNLIEFFDEFLPECLPNYRNLTGDVLADRNVSYALHPPVIRLMANAWARWKLDRQKNTKELIPVIGNINIRTADPGNALENELAVMYGSRKKFRPARHDSWEAATNTILDMVEGTGKQERS